MRAVDVQVAPTSFAQRRLWLLEHLRGRQAAYNVPLTFRLQGALDIPALQRSLDWLIRRHGSLRTSFRWDGNNLVQVTLPAVAAPVRVVQLSSGSRDDRLAAALSDAAQQAAKAFDLETPPLLRATLYCLSADDHVLGCCFHGAIFDGPSEGAFLRELGSFYSKAESDVATIAATSESRLKSDSSGTAVLEGEARINITALVDRESATPATHYTLNLPYDRPRPAEARGRGGVERLDLSRSLVAALEVFSSQQGTTLSTVLLAAYSLVLHRYSGNDDFLIGTVKWSPGPEAGERIGCFSGAAPVRIDLRGNPSFVTVLRRIRQAAPNGEVDRDDAFEIDELAPFQVMFVQQTDRGAVPAFGRLRVTPLEIHNGTSKCDLLLEVGPRSDDAGVTLRMEFDADLFDVEAVSRLLTSYHLVLEAVIAEAERPIAVLPLVSQQDRSLIAQWSSATAEYPRASAIHREFEAVAKRMRSAVALSMGSERMTYAELDAAANRVAHRLRRGIQRGELVGVCLERSLPAIVAQLAVLKAGGAYLPLDPSYPRSRLEFMIEDAGVRVVVASRATSALVPQGVGQLLSLDEEAASIRDESPASLACDVGCDDLAYVMYTSGSTGRPNGVRVPHRGVLRLVLGTDYVDWQRATTFLQMAPLSFDASTFEIWGALLHGARLVVFPETVPTVTGLGSVLAAEGVDCLWLTAALFNVIVDESPECLASVPQLIVGGEALSVPHVVRAQQHLPSVNLINGYGPTECTTFACCYPIPRLSPSDTSIPIGRPIANTSVHIWDRRKQVVPIGVAGELYLGGDGVALGYVARPELTAERFVRDPASKSGALLYRTGDLARWRVDGTIEFLGRRDSQLKVRGFRVEPGEIEAACRMHPAVRDAVALLDRSRPGEDGLIAFVVRDTTRPLSSTELQEFLSQRVPNHLVPSTIVVREGFPLTPNGKVDRDALLAEQQSELGSKRPERSVRPRTATEESLLEIWRELLQVDQIGLHDDFFAIGGHSLLAVRMFARIHDVFGRSLPFSTLLHDPTIAGLGAVLGPSPVAPAAPSSLVPLKRGGDRPPMFLVHGIGSEVWTFLELVKQLPEDQPVFGVLPSDNAKALCPSISEMASAYLADIEAVVQGRPFIVGGHCSGAVTAFEIARQRRLHGHHEPLLVVFDYWFDEERPGIVRLGRNFVNWVFEDFLHSSVKNNLGRIRSRMRLLRSRLRAFVTRQTPSDDVRDLLGMWRYPDHEVERLRRFTEALEAYRFSPHEGPIHVFRARTHRLSVLQPTDDMGWTSIARGDLAIETVPGSHDSMFTHPFVRVLARRLTVALERHSANRGVATHQTDEQIKT